ncbi:hypothetical protein MTO96_034673 [Rhipicephalus appendiculatus]
MQCRLRWSGGVEMPDASCIRRCAYVDSEWQLPPLQRVSEQHRGAVGRGKAGGVAELPLDSVSAGHFQIHSGASPTVYRRQDFGDAVPSVLLLLHCVTAFSFTRQRSVSCGWLCDMQHKTPRLCAGEGTTPHSTSW